MTKEEEIEQLEWSIEQDLKRLSELYYQTKNTQESFNKMGKILWETFGFKSMFKSMFKNLDWYMIFAVIGASIVIGVFVWEGFLLHDRIKEEHRIFQECLKEHKNYECHAMLDTHNQTYFMPVIMPTKR